jgi:hypothetical protein
MALIIYPEEGYNSFITTVDADAIIGGFVVSDGVSKYLALDEASKEAILRQTALQIKLCPNMVLPDTNESDLGLAQCYLTIHALTVDMISYDPSARSITEERVDTLGVSYDIYHKEANSHFDPITRQLLSQYGCSSGGSFSQVAMGRS